MDDSQLLPEVWNTQTRTPHRWRSALPGQMSDVKTKLTVIRQVDRNRARWIKLRCEWLSRRTILLASEERRWGSCRRDRSKAVIAKAISEATKAVEKASAEAQSCTAGVREGSDGTLSSPMSSPIDKFEKSTESNSQYAAEEDESSRTSKRTCCKASCNARESDENEVKKRATRDKLEKSSRVTEEVRKLKSKLKDELSIVSTATEVQGQEMMMIVKHVNLTVQGDRAARQGQSEQGKDRESTTAVRCETSQRKVAASQSRTSKNRCRCPAGASRWYGHQEKTTILL